MFVNPWQFCVAIILMIFGTYLIVFRFWYRRKGISVEILSVKPRVLHYSIGSRADDPL